MAQSVIRLIETSGKANSIFPVTKEDFIYCVENNIFNIALSLYVHRFIVLCMVIAVVS